MGLNLINYFLFVQLLQWYSVESVTNINLPYCYKKEGEINRAVCNNEPEYAVPSGPEVTLNVETMETFAYAQCSLLHNESVIVTRDFELIAQTRVYRGKLAAIGSEPYICSFYVLQRDVKHFEPISIFNNITYVRISCIFKLNLYCEKTVLLTVAVNEQTLVTKMNSIDNSLYSEYLYENEDDKLTVTCNRDIRTKGHVELPIKGECSHDQKFNVREAVLQINHASTLGAQFRLQCCLTDGNRNLEVYNIYFARKSCLYDLNIHGLSLSNTIHEASNFLHYKYTEYEKLNFVCSTTCPNNVYCQMDVFHNDLKINYTAWIGGSGVELAHTFILTPSDNSSIVKCTLRYNTLTDMKETKVKLLYTGIIRVDNIKPSRPHGKCSACN